MKQESTVDLLLDVDQRPSAGKGILLSFQHVFAMFGATILVPLILGMPCLLYTSPSPRDVEESRMPSSA